MLGDGNVQGRVERGFEQKVTELTERRKAGPEWGCILPPPFLPVNPCGTNVHGRFVRCYPCGQPCGGVQKPAKLV